MTDPYDQQHAGYPSSAAIDPDCSIQFEEMTPSEMGGGGYPPSMSGGGQYSSRAGSHHAASSVNEHML